MTKKQKYNLDIKPPQVKKTRVLIDLDGVVRDFIGSLVQVYHRVYPDHKVLPVNSRKLEDFFPIGDEIYEFLEKGYIEEIMERATAYDGAVEALAKWKDEFEIVIVSAQPDVIVSSTYLWIGKNQIPTNEVHISYNKSKINGFALLDDFTYNLQEFASTSRLAVCLDQAWNKDWTGPRVKNVDEFFHLVQSELYGSGKKSVDEQYFT
jgi:5'(3')-deoxyribonucleotidase